MAGVPGDSTPGPRLTLRAICTGTIGATSFLEDAAGGPRSGVAVTGQTALTAGHRYLWAGSARELNDETQVTARGYLYDYGAVTTPAPAVQTIAVLRNTSCDASQSIVNSEDYEGVLVRVQQVKVAAFANLPREPALGGAFLVTGPLDTYSDTMLVVQGPGGSFAPDTLQVLNITGIVSPNFVANSATNRLVTRSNADIQVARTLDVEDPALQELSLAAYPNPTLGHTSITLALPRRDRIGLDVFDLRGRRVARIADGVLDAGAHRFSWTGADSRGRAVESGMYFIRLTVGSETRVTRSVRIAD
jgi:hypothetical protein